MQDTFVELIAKKNRFRNESQFKTYLFRIARNKAIDYIRKASKTVFLLDEITLYGFVEMFAAKVKYTECFYYERNVSISKPCENLPNQR